MFGKAALPAAFLVSVAFADILDDASSAIAYHGIWNHDSNQASPIHDGTISYSDDPGAWLQFNFTGTGFTFNVGKKRDRGKFLVTIDDVFAGSGRAHDASITDDQAQPSVVFEVENLDRAKHQVSVWNFKEQDVEGCDGQCFLALDYIDFEATEATTTLIVDSTQGYPSTASDDHSSNSYGGGAPDSGSDNDGHSDGVVIGGAVGGALAALVLVGLGFVGWLLWRRRQQGQGLLKGRRPSLDADFDHSRNMAEHGAAGQYSSVPGTSSSATSPALNSSNYFGRQPSIYQGGGADGLDLHGGNAPPSYDLASEGLRNSLGPTSTNFSTADNSGPESSNTPTSSSPLSLPAGASGGHPHSNKGIFAANGLTQQNH